MRTWALLVAAFLVGACAQDTPHLVETETTAPYRHNLRDYVSFRDRHPTVEDPNYLPFMTHRVEVPAAEPRGWWGRFQAQEPAGERLVLCRWDDSEFPLRVHLVPPVIDPDAHEFQPREPREYTAAVQRALSIWQRDLEGEVSFREVRLPEEARLVIRLVGGRAPVERDDVTVLGIAKTGNACRVRGGDPATGQLEVEFRVPELVLYLEDDHGLLLPDQVEKVALHELGHALGMQAHSPLPSDLMFRVAQDRISRDGLGPADLNSFHTLYGLPNGTIYARPLAVDEKLAALPPGEEPALDLAPHVDARLGFEIQTPVGWARLSSRYGIVAVDGVAWEYGASFQLNVHRFDDVESYLRRYGRGHLRNSRPVDDQMIEINGRPVRRIVLETPHGTLEEFSLFATSDGRVLVAIGEAPLEQYSIYTEWFAAILESLEVRTDRTNVYRDYAE